MVGVVALELAIFMAVLREHIAQGIKSLVGKCIEFEAVGHIELVVQAVLVGQLEPSPILQK